MTLSKKIIIILPFFTLGGAETQAFHVAYGFKKAGHRVTVVAFQQKNGLLIEKLEEAGIEWKESSYDLSLIHQKGTKKFSELLKYGFFLRKMKPDYLFPFTYYPNILTSAIWRITGAKKCFWNQRGKEELNVNMIERIAIKAKPNYLANAIVCADFIAKRHSFSSNVIRVIPNAVQPSNPLKSKSEWQIELNLSSKDFVCIMVANYFSEKKHDFLLKGWKSFIETYPELNARLILVGYSPTEYGETSVKALAFDLKLYDSLRFIQSSNDISGLLQIANAGILISSSEGCPNTVLEYMSAGIPAIVSDIPATREIFSENYPLFVDLENIETLVQAIEKCTNSEFNEVILKENLQLIKERFTLPVLEEAYNKLVEQ